MRGCTTVSTDIDVLKAEMRPFVKRSVTTGAGNVAGTTLVDSTLVEPDNFWNEGWVLLRTGTYAGELRKVADFDQATNTITLDHSVGGQIVTGVQYVMLPRYPTSDPEKWLHDYHWDCDEVTINVAGGPGEQNLGGAVPAGVVRRIRELTIRHAGTNNTVVTLLIAGGAPRLSIDVPAQSTRVWSSEDGREFLATEQPAVQSSDVTGGNTYVSASGVEA